jgi:Double-GTPase 2
VIHIWIKRTCPVCMEPFYPGDCAIISANTSGKVLKAAPVGWHKALERMLPLPLEGSAFINEGAYRQCPNTTCNYRLPRYIEVADNVNIVVAGDTFSGKSHYIAAMIYEILHGRLQQASQFFRVSCTTQDIENLYRRDVLDPLFQRKQVLPPTQTAIDVNRYPLIYELVIRPSAEHPPRRVNLLFYDAAGEDLADEDRLIRFSRYVFNASGIIFLVDPGSIPAFAQALPPHLQSRTARGQTSSDVLNSIIKLMESYRKRDAGARFSSIPLAITIAKSDLIGQVQADQQKYTFWQKKHNDGIIDWPDLNKVNEEVRQFLVDYGENQLLQATLSLSKVRFFATSATGNAPDAQGRYTDIDPIRCLDPVMWMLYELGILRTI